MNSSATEEWKNKFHSIDFIDDIKILPLLFEDLQALWLRSVVESVYCFGYKPFLGSNILSWIENAGFAV
jgi:hypothetical protein